MSDELIEAIVREIAEQFSPATGYDQLPDYMIRAAVMRAIESVSEDAATEKAAG